MQQAVNSIKCYLQAERKGQDMASIQLTKQAVHSIQLGNLQLTKQAVNSIKCYLQAERKGQDMASKASQNQQRDRIRRARREVRTQRRSQSR